jgi:hypothetical protein
LTLLTAPMSVAQTSSPDVVPSYYSQSESSPLPSLEPNWSSAAGTGVIDNSGCAGQAGCGVSSNCCSSCGSANCQCFRPFSFYVLQTADFVTNVSFPGRIRQNAFGFSFLDGLSPNDAFFGVPQFLTTNGLASGITDTLPFGGVGGGIGLPLLPLTTTTNTVTMALPGGVTDFLSGLINAGLPGTISIAPAFQDDWQYQTAGGVFYQLPLGDNVSFTTGLDYYQVLHNEAKQFDLQTPSATGVLGVRLTDRIVTSTVYQYQYNFLRGQTLANVHLFGQNMFFALNDRWLLQSGLGYGQSTFQPAPAFDASSITGNLAALRFLGANRTSYLIGGYNYGKSDAAVNSFSYNANSLYAGGRWLLGPTLQNDFQLFSSLTLYDFDNPDPVQVGTVRNDHNATYSARLARWITPQASLYGQYTFANNNSNIVRQDFDSSFISFGGTFVR